MCITGFSKSAGSQRARSPARERTRAQASFPFPAVAASSSSSGRPSLNANASRALAPETLLSPLCPLLGEAYGHSREGWAFTASPTLPRRCLEPGVPCHHYPVNYVNFLFPPFPPYFRTFPQAFLNLLIPVWLPKAFKASAACSFQQLMVMFEVQFSLDGIMLYGYSYPG